MKKRAKLDLSAGIGQGKAQAAGFDPAPPADSVTESQDQDVQERAFADERQSRQAGAVASKRWSPALIVPVVKPNIEIPTIELFL